MCPKNISSVSVAKKDNEGNLVSNRVQLQNLYVTVYKEYEQLKEHKEYLFELRLKLAKARTSSDWTKSDLLKVLKNLKVNKATDPVGLVSELFKPGVAGSDVVSSVLTLCNMIKYECFLSISRGQ